MIRIGRLLIALVTIAALAGCLRSAAAPHKGKLRVACVGASITFGATLQNREITCYPARMQQILGEGYEVRNFGASGCTMLKKGDRPYWKSAKYQQALEMNPDIVVIDLGGNDSKAMNWKYKEDFAADTRGMIASFRALPSRPRVLLCLPMPSFRPPSAGINDVIITGEQIPSMLRVGRETRTEVVDLHEPFRDKKSWFRDGIHPNEEGAALMAKVIGGAIASK